MTITHVRCGCGVVEVQLTGEPIVQYVCHCDDCQAVHGKAYPVALYPVSAVAVTRGEKFHVQCRYAATRIEDDLPHYKDKPSKFRGSGEIMSW